MLYMEPVGFGHQAISDSTNIPDGGNSTATPRIVYLINMTADIIISDSTGTELQTLENLPTESFISHEQNTEFSLTLTVSQSQPFPEGDYILTYVVHDQVTGQSFQIDRRITIEDNAITGVSPLPDAVLTMDATSQQSTPEPLLQERSWVHKWRAAARFLSYTNGRRMHTSGLTSRNK